MDSVYLLTVIGNTKLCFFETAFNKTVQSFTANLELDHCQCIVQNYIVL